MLYRLFAILGILCIIGLSTGCSKTTDPECEVLDTAFHGEWDFYRYIEYNVDGSVKEDNTSLPDDQWDIFFDETEICNSNGCEEYCLIDGTFSWGGTKTSVFFDADQNLIISTYLGNGTNEYIHFHQFFVKI